MRKAVIAMLRGGSVVFALGTLAATAHAHTPNPACSEADKTTRFMLEVSEEERAREQNDKVAAACAIAAGYAHTTSCTELRTSCASGTAIRIRNPWVDGEQVVYIPCEVMISLTCAEGEGDLDTCQLQNMREACEQTLASSSNEDPGFFSILCDLAATFIPGLACVAVFPWALGLPCAGAGGGLGITISRLGCALL